MRSHTTGERARRPSPRRCDRSRKLGRGAHVAVERCPQTRPPPLLIAVCSGGETSRLHLPTACNRSFSVLVLHLLTPPTRTSVERAGLGFLETDNEGNGRV